MASVTKDFHRLLKRVSKVTDGQATIQDIDWDDGTLQKFHVIIQPNCGLYKNGRFKFEFKIPEDYPDMPPIVWCHTDIYHPNIDPTEESYDNPSTNVCLNVLECGVWSRSFGLEGAILGLLFLMHNPNLEDPLSPYFEGQDDQESFEENVRKYMAGEEFEDMTFETDFCVKDGILVVDQKIVSTETNNAQQGNLIDEGTKELKMVNDVILDTENKSTNSNEKSAVESGTNVVNEISNGASNEPKCSSSKQDEHFTKEEGDEIVNKDADASKLVAENEKGTWFLDTQACDLDINESNDCDIELVNIGGECVFLIHRSASYDSDLSQDTNNTVETVTDNEVLEDTGTPDDSNTKPQENTEIETESNIVCIEHNSSSLTTGINAAESGKDNVYITEATQKKGDEFTNTLPSFESEINLNDKETECADRENGLSNEAKCGCGAFYTIRSAFSKIVHTIGHNKLYRDIGI